MNKAVEVAAKLVQGKPLSKLYWLADQVATQKTMSAREFRKALALCEEQLKILAIELRDAARQSAPPQTPAPDEQRLCARCSGVVVDRRTMQPIAASPVSTGADAKDAARLTLTGKQILQLGEFVGLVPPSIVEAADCDCLETEITIGYVRDVEDDDGNKNSDLHAWFAEYPDEGCIPLCAAMSDEACARTKTMLAKCMALFDAAYPSQDGLPELPQGKMAPIGEWVTRDSYRSEYMVMFTADQMLAYGAQCRAAAIPEGFVVVPREPTLEMIAAPGMATAMRSGSAAQIYRAMLAASGVKQADAVGASAQTNETKAPDLWIACSERLPENDADVLACSFEHGINVAWFDASVFKVYSPSFADYSDWPILNPVTHWMPLPAPPLAAAPKGEGK